MTFIPVDHLRKSGENGTTPASEHRRLPAWFKVKIATFPLFS